MNIKFRDLRPEEVDVRVAQITAKGCSLLLYKDARCDMNILDETVGPDRWQRNHELINGNLFCNVGIKVGEEWVWKQDVGTESYTEKEKGQASDSFKRACFNWGIGRELYTSPFIWIDRSDVDIVEENGKFKVKDTFFVSQLVIENKKIIGLEIKRNKKRGKEETAVFGFGKITIDTELRCLECGEPITDYIYEKNGKQIKMSAYKFSQQYGGKCAKCVEKIHTKHRQVSGADE